MRIYQTMMSTSLGPLDVALGEIAWAMVRGAAYAIGFTVVAAMFGLLTTWWSLLMIPAAVLVAGDGCGVDSSSFLLANADPDRGDHDLVVEGGIWDGNNAANRRA